MNGTISHTTPRRDQVFVPALNSPESLYILLSPSFFYHCLSSKRNSLPRGNKIDSANSALIQRLPLWA